MASSLVRHAVLRLLASALLLGSWSACDDAQGEPSADGGGADRGRDASPGDGSVSRDGQLPGQAEGGAAEGGSQRTCGGFLGLGCEAGEFCNQAIAAGGQGCDVADGTGTCQLRPQACDDQYAPVCGCDGQTYSNACNAHAQGVSVDREGTCRNDKASCDATKVSCRQAPPSCPEGQAPSVQGLCWGPCVAIEECACSKAADCPLPEQYTCHLHAQHCGPYVQ